MCEVRCEVAEELLPCRQLPFTLHMTKLPFTLHMTSPCG
jgi:hypothetical protein